MGRLVELFVRFDDCERSILNCNPKAVGEDQEPDKGVLLCSVGSEQFDLASQIAETPAKDFIELAIKALVLADFASDEPDDLVDGLTNSLCSDLLEIVGRPIVIGRGQSNATVALSRGETLGNVMVALDKGLVGISSLPNHAEDEH